MSEHSKELQVLLDHLSDEANLLHQAKLRRQIQRMFKEQEERVEELEEELTDETLVKKGYKYALDKYKEENHRYKQALKFYADRKNYEVVKGDELNEPYVPVNIDYGVKARKALEQGNE